MVRNYPVRHTKSTVPIVLTDASLVDAGGGEHTVADASKVAKAGDTMTGGLVIQVGGVTDNSLTASRIPFAGTAGRLLDDAKLAWDNVAKFLSVGATYKFVVLGDQAANGDLPANHVLMASYLGNLAFFASSTTGGAAYKVICGYYNGAAIKSAWEVNNTAGGALGHLQLMKNGGYVSIGGGTQLSKAVVYTPSLTPASVSAGAGVEQTFAVSGLTTGDTVTVNAPAGAVFSARVTAANTLGITFMPPASGSYTPPAGTYRVLAIRS